MRPGTIVEFTNKQGKYFVRVDEWCGPSGPFCGGIDSDLWLIKLDDGTYHRGTFGFFSMEDCSNIQVCHDEEALSYFVE